MKIKINVKWKNISSFRYPRMEKGSLIYQQYVSSSREYLSGYKHPCIVIRFVSSTIYQTSGTDRRWRQTRTLFIIINIVMVDSFKSSSVHAGMVCATRFHTIQNLVFTMHPMPIDVECLRSIGWWYIDSPCQGWLRKRRWQVGGGAHGLESRRRWLPGHLLLDRQLCTGAERLHKRFKLDFVAGMTGGTNPERPVSLKWLSVSHRSLSTSGRLASSFLRAWLLVILLSLKVLARSLSRANCAGDLRFYPMFRPLFASVEPTLDTLWRGENLTLTTTAPDFSS